MMMGFGLPGFFEMVLLTLLGGNTAIPISVPPSPEDAMLVRVAPADCFFYTAWSGTAEADPKSENHTERLIAEPEVRQLVADAERLFKAAMKNATEGDLGGPEAEVMRELVPKWGKALLTKPLCIYVENFKPRPDGVDVKGGLIVRVDEQADEFKADLEKIAGLAPDDAVKSVDIDGRSFHQFRFDASAPVITVGVRGIYLIIGVGDNAVEDMFANVRRNVTPDGKPNAPQWLADVREALPVERVSTVSFINVAKILEAARGFGGPDADRVISALGFDDLTSLSSVTGLDESGFVNRTLLSSKGKFGGILSALESKPLTADDLAGVPPDAPVAIACRLDARRVFDNFIEMIGVMEPRAVAEINEGIRDMEDQLGFRIREDLLASLGDSWQIYASPANGNVVTGWTAVARVRNHMTLLDAHDSLVRAARESFTDDPWSPKLKQIKFEGHDIYSLSVPDNDMPFELSWCLTRKEFVFGLFPQAVKARLAAAQEMKSLADHPNVAALLKGDNGPIVISYVDSKRLFEYLYPALQIGAQFAFAELSREMDIDLDASILPSTAAVGKHLQPSVSAVRRTEAGVEFVSHQTLPSSSIGASAPVLVALLLPAVQSARLAARRMQGSNNLKQIALAMHNYHDVNRGLPAAYSMDEDGKPLLSWRVHILPYIEHQALYERFHLDEPWDSEHNKELIPLMPLTYASPQSKHSPDSGKTDYVTVRHENSPFPVPGDGNKGRTENPIGKRFADILDGTSNTILVVEAGDEAAVTWTKPDDFTPDEDDLMKGLLGLYPRGFQAAFCDGSVHFLAESIDLDLLKNLMHRDDGNPVRLP